MLAQRAHQTVCRHVWPQSVLECLGGSQEHVLLPAKERRPTVKVRAPKGNDY
mgnify:CR=1 FL=1